MLQLLQRLALYQLAPDTIEDKDEQETLRNLAIRMSPEDVQLFYQIGLIGSRDLTYAPDPHAAFEMILLRMLCFRPVDETTAPPATALPNQDRTAETASSIQPSKRQSVPETTSSQADWPNLVAQLKLTAIPRQLAENCALERCERDTFYLQLAPNMANLHSKRAEDRLRQALEEHYGRSVRLIVRITNPNSHSDTVAARRKKEQATWHHAALESIQNDANIKAFRETFDAQLPLESVRPLIEPEQK